MLGGFVADLQPGRAWTLEERDVWRGAHALVDGFGTMAPTHAARRALALVASGDSAGYLTWLRILQAVDTLLEEKKKASGTTSRVA